jgi:hypothetical protein
MPWSAGTFSRANGATGWQDDQAANIGIEAGRHDTQDNDFRNGINETINKAGQNTPTANLPMGGFKHTGVANAAASSEYAAYGQVQAGVNVQSTTLDWTATQYSNDVAAAKFVLQKSRGATTGSNVIVANGDSIGSLEFRGNNGATFTNAASISVVVDGTPGVSNDMPGGIVFSTTGDGSGTPTERMRLASNGTFLVGTTSGNPISSGVVGARIVDGSLEVNRDGNTAIYCGRLNSDGNLVEFFRATGVVGAISVAGGVVSYGAFCGNHWAQLAGGMFANILPGTVLETIDELCQWPGETEDRLARVQVSTTAASKAVYGVFINWDAEWTATHDMRVASLGAYFVRVHSSQTVQNGDLLESNGDGTARVQASDTIKSSTIGKVTCAIPSETYPDGSYLIPAVLCCG